MNDDTQEKITKYLAKFFPAHEIAEDDDIFKLGFVNSMFAIQLVNFVEHEFAIEIDNEDMELDNFPVHPCPDQPGPAQVAAA